MVGSEIMTKTIDGQLEIDSDRGVIYFHASNPKIVKKYMGATIVRICQLPTPIPEGFLDITHLYGANWEEKL